MARKADPSISRPRTATGSWCLDRTLEVHDELVRVYEREAAALITARLAGIAGVGFAESGVGAEQLWNVQVIYTTEATSPDEDNEDYVVAGPGWVAVFDGATAPPGVDSGCRHGPGWLVRRLAGAVAGGLARERGEPLPDLLAAGIEAVRDAHADACDLGNPDSPSATVTILRRHRARLDWLVLADSPLVLDFGGQIRVVRDDRVDHLPGYTRAAVRAARNTAGGFWVAAARPDAAYEAVTGVADAVAVRRAGVFSDGASRLVERFGVLGWEGLLDLLDSAGPGEVIRRTRDAERADGERRGKRHDDATAVLVRFG